MSEEKQIAILLVGHGTSHLSAYEKSFLALLSRVKASFPGVLVDVAFTSSKMRDQLKHKHQMCVMALEEALEGLLSHANQVLVQPIQLLPNIAYADLDHHCGRLKQTRAIDIRVGRPLMAWHQDYEVLADALLKEVPPLKVGEARVFVGHGTEHVSQACYAQLEGVLKARDAHNWLITLEAFPQLKDITHALKSYQHVQVVPLLYVAGAHATKDIWGDRASSVSNQLHDLSLGVSYVKKGLGEYKSIQDLLLERIKVLLKP